MTAQTTSVKTRDYVALANAYAANVIAGTIPACKWVKLACERQINDLKRRKFKYHFDEAKAARVCKFIELLPHIKGEWAGKPIQLEPWQMFILTCVFGWVDEKGRRRFKTAYTEIPRKNAKSTLSSGVGLYMLTADGEGGPEVYSAATTKDQAKIVWQDAHRMAQKAKGLAARFGVATSAHSIYTSDGGSFRALARDQGGNLDGLNVHCGIIDELHAHKTREVWDVIETATGARSQPLLWGITTAGFNRAGICYEQRTYVTKVLQQVATDEEYFGIIYTLDDQPYVQSFNFVQSLNEIERRCNCGCVPITQIERLFAKVFATHATRHTGVPPQQIDALTTQIDTFGTEDSAEVATSSGGLIITQNTRQEALQNALNGLPTIKIELKSHLKSGELNQKANESFSIISDSYDTELHESNTTSATKSKKASAASAASSTKLYASITATLQAKLEASSADSATQQLVYSEILKNIYNGHSTTCAVREVTLDGAGITATMPADDWTNPGVWAKANPNWDVSVKPDDIARKARKAQEMAAAQNNFLTKHLNVWVNADTAWMDMKAWEACADTELTLDQFKHDEVWIALDLASKIDVAAKVYIFKRDEEYVLIPRFYLPEDATNQPEAAHYAGWAKDGFLCLTDGNVTDFGTIEEELRDDAERFTVVSMGYDPWQATYLATRLAGEGLPVKEYRNTVQNMSEPMKQLEMLVKSGKLRHDGNPMMTWMISNVVAHIDAKENIFPRKEQPQNKIDGPVAAIMALGEIITTEQESGSVYDERGFLSF